MASKYGSDPFKLEIDEKKNQQLEGKQKYSAKKVKEQNLQAYGISAHQALMNMCRATVGTGVLALPLAFKESGLWCGVGLIIVAGYFTYLSCHKIVRSSQALVKRHNISKLDYGEVAEMSFKTSFPIIRPFGKFFRLFTNFSILLMQMGICSVFTVFLKEHLEEIWSRFSQSSSPSQWIFFGFVVTALCLIVLVRHIRIISFVSMIGNILMSVVLLLVVQDLVRPPFHFNNLPSFQSLSGVVLAAGNIIYAFESQAVILPLENKMKYPQEMFGWRGVLSLGCTIATIIYQVIGFFGYLKYGDAVRGAITLNLPDTSFYFFVRVLLVGVVYLTYLINQFVIVDMSWPKISDFLSRFSLFNKIPLIFEAIYKIFLVLVAFLIAACVPNLGQITSLVGVTAGNLLGLIIPPFIHTATFLPEWLAEKNYSKMFIHMFSNVIFLVFGVFFMITGVIGNLKER